MSALGAWCQTRFGAPAPNAGFASVCVSRLRRCGLAFHTRDLGPIAIAAVLSLAAACGEGDKAAADATPPDASASADGNRSGDGGAGNDSPFTMVSCGAGVDAGVGAPDAMPSLDASVPPADAGSLPGLDEPCCNPDGACADDFACVEGPAPSSEHHCRPLCDLMDNLCPAGGICANFGGQGVCIVAGAEGDDCSPELCSAETICVGDTAEDALCRRRCDGEEDCDEGTNCTALSGASAMACL